MKKTVMLALVVGAFAGLAVAQDVKPPAQPQTQSQPRSERRFGLDAPKARAPGAIRIATYNIENLFDDKDDPALSGRYEDKDMTKPEPAMRAAAAAIRAIDADVIALQEVESKDALIWFRDRYLAGLGYEHVASIDAGDERGIEQAFLSRFPIIEAKNWVGLELGGVHPEKWGNQPNDRAGRPITYHRSPLLVTIEAPAPKTSEGEAEGEEGKPYRLTLVAVHHKSGRDGEYWRQKEAAKTVELLGATQKEAPETNMVLLGDFNAVLRDASVKIVTDAGWYDVFAAKHNPTAGGRNDPTIITHASGRIYDRILLNPAARREYVPESAFVLGTPPRGNEGYASDHNPVVIDLIPRDAAE